MRASVFIVVISYFLFLGYIEAGKILFFMPILPKSTTMILNPIVEEMAKKGHDVTFVNPFGTKAQYSTLKQIKPSFNVDEMLNSISVEMLTDNMTSAQITKLLMQKSKIQIQNAWHDIFPELKSEYD